MKNLIMTSTLFLSATVLIGAAQAQSIKVSIPFAFEANGKSLAAGNYSVQPVSVGGSHIFAIRNMEDHTGALLSVKMPITYSTEETKLVFRRFADGYYLTEVWDGRMGKELSAPHGRGSVVASTKVVIPASK